MVNSAAGDKFHSDARNEPDLQHQPIEKDTSYRLADFLVIACILILGALAFFSRDRASDFLYDDVYYADCAKSLLARGFYGILNRPETTQPPGVSAILALLCRAGGCTRAVFLGAMAVFDTLGFLACYTLLRRELPRAIAGAICLLLMSSSLYFSLATQWISTCFPFLFATMSALLVARKLEKATRRASQFAWGFLLSVLLAASLMFGSTAIALLGSIFMWIAVGMLRDRACGAMRLQKFLAVLLVAVTVEGIWMSRKPFDEWARVPGFPGPYLQQLFLKNGHDPELGRAALSDILARIGHKAFEQSEMLANVLFRHWIDASWMSLLILGPVILILVGWSYSLWKTGGGLEEWYFAGAQFILLMWPWRLDSRSFLPLAPLACLYVWRGALGVGLLAKNKPRVLGVAWPPIAASLAFASWMWMRGAVASSPARHGGLQARVSFAVWMLSGILAGCLAWKGSGWMDSVAPLANRILPLISALRISPRGIAQLLGGSLVAGLFILGVADQLEIRRGNLDLASAQHRVPSDLEAALWVREHTESNAVVMARQVPITYHYSGREMVWFPPSSNPQILMEGIRKYKVNYVILIRRKQSYFLPPEEDCFAAMLAQNANAFRLVAETSGYRIYETGRPVER
jgi:hypothetical protein